MFEKYAQFQFNFEQVFYCLFHSASTVKDITKFSPRGSGFEGYCRECSNKMQRALRNGTTSESGEAQEKRRADVTATIDSTIQRGSWHLDSDIPSERVAFYQHPPNNPFLPC